jgi:hypothetical protein
MQKALVATFVSLVVCASPHAVAASPITWTVSDTYYSGSFDYDATSETFSNISVSSTLTSVTYTTLDPSPPPHPLFSDFSTSMGSSNIPCGLAQIARLPARGEHRWQRQRIGGKHQLRRRLLDAAPGHSCGSHRRAARARTRLAHAARSRPRGHCRTPLATAERVIATSRESQAGGRRKAALVAARGCCPRAVQSEVS